MKRAELLDYINLALGDSLAGCDSGNPLESWTRFIDRLDAKGRSHIGDALERQGRNRYTGEAIKNVQRDSEYEAILGPEDFEG